MSRQSWTSYGAPPSHSPPRVRTLMGDDCVTNSPVYAELYAETPTYDTRSYSSYSPPGGLDGSLGSVAPAFSRIPALGYSPIVSRAMGRHRATGPQGSAQGRSGGVARSLLNHINNIPSEPSWNMEGDMDDMDDIGWPYPENASQTTPYQSEFLPYVSPPRFPSPGRFPVTLGADFRGPTHGSKGQSMTPVVPPRSRGEDQPISNALRVSSSAPTISWSVPHSKP